MPEVPTLPLSPLRLGLYILPPSSTPLKNKSSPKYKDAFKLGGFGGVGGFREKEGGLGIFIFIDMGLPREAPCFTPMFPNLRGVLSD